MKILVLVLFFTTVSLMEAKAANSTLKCKDRSGLYEAQIQIDFSTSKTYFNKSYYCSGEGQCYADSYGEDICECSNWTTYNVENVTWPFKLKYRGESQSFEWSGKAVASGTRK